MINGLFKLLTKTKMEFMVGFNYLACSGFFIDSVQVVYLLLTDEHLKVNIQRVLHVRVDISYLKITRID